MNKTETEARKIFRAHRSSAESRGIPFRLTFAEWFAVWKPYWPAKQLGAALHMCRNGDSGAYELGNVRIDTPTGNAADRSKESYQRQPYELRMPTGKTLPDRIGRLEVRAMRKALAAAQWNMTAAARLLGITFRAMRYAMAKHSGRIGRTVTTNDSVRANSDLNIRPN
jgi:hypothetical protein